MTEPSAALSRLLALVQREVHAEDVSVSKDAPDATDERAIVVALGSGNHLVARFAEPPPDRAAVTRRIEALVASFADLTPDPRELHAAPESRAPVPEALHDALRALAEKAGALDAVVIDAHSPVVWGSANVRQPQSGLVRTPDVDAAIEWVERTRRGLTEAILAEQAPHSVPQDREPLEKADSDPKKGDSELPRDRTQAALKSLRADAALHQLKRGRPLRERVVQSGVAYLASSFATIYVMVLVFDGDFDELRAERALHEQLGRIERLVLALPPLDPEPSPVAGVVRFRKRPRS
jgi:hypothetical protein